MLAKSFLAATWTAFCAGVCLAQSPVPATAPAGAPIAWKSAAETAAGATATLPQGGAPGADQPRRTIARVTTGNGTLPNEQGQVWREYDISPYTLRVASTSRPEQAIVDWILRETGYESWHFQPLGILDADQRTLRVYHIPQMQAVVADIVDRFVSSEAQTQSFGLRLVTVDQPNWRARAQRVVRPVQVQTPGVQAWLLAPEDASVLLAELARRADFHEHGSPHLLVSNGQPTVVSSTRARTYAKGVAARPEAWPGFELESGVVDEGYSLEFTPLLSTDGQIVDVVVSMTIDQVEKMVPVVLDVPTPSAPRQRTKIEVPQMAHLQFRERFRWPVDQVLLVDLGMVPLPVPSDGKSLVPGIPLPLPTSAPRADVMIFIEAKGKIAAPAAAPNPAANPATANAPTYRGRY